MINYTEESWVFMITIIIHGLDQFIVGQLSKVMSLPLANLYEIGENEINFIAPESMVFHDGVEQTSWRAIITVKAPKKTEVIQKMVAEYLIAMIKDVAVHIEIVFTYFSADNLVEHINKEYPLFITEENIVSIEDEYEEHDEEDVEIERGDDGEELFVGDIFEGFTGDE